MANSSAPIAASGVASDSGEVGAMPAVDTPLPSGVKSSVTSDVMAQPMSLDDAYERDRAALRRLYPNKGAAKNDTDAKPASTKRGK